MRIVQNRPGPLLLSVLDLQQRFRLKISKGALLTPGCRANRVAISLFEVNKRLQFPV